MEIKTILLSLTLLSICCAIIYVYFKNDKPKYKNDKPDIIFDDYITENKNRNFIPEEDDIEYNHKKIIYKNNGNTILCDALKNITGNNINSNYEFKTGDKNILVDCYDKKTNIAVDYKTEENYNYNSNNNVSLYDWYDSYYNSIMKENFFNKFKIDYLKIPYIIDRCYKLDKKEYICENSVSDNIRELRMTDYLKKAISVY